MSETDQADDAPIERCVRDSAANGSNGAHIPTDARDAMVKDYVLKIAAAWNKAVASIIETGKLLIEAKAKLKAIKGTGHWQKMVGAAESEGRLPFKIRVAQMLMEIAEHPVLSNPQNFAFLPPHYPILHKFCSFDQAELERRFKDGSINPGMTHLDVAKLHYHPLENLLKGLNAWFFHMKRVPNSAELFDQMSFLLNWHVDHADALNDLNKLTVYLKEFASTYEKWVEHSDPHSARRWRKMQQYQGKVDWDDVEVIREPDPDEQREPRTDWPGKARALRRLKEKEADNGEAVQVHAESGSDCAEGAASPTPRRVEGGQGD